MRDKFLTEKMGLCWHEDFRYSGHDKFCTGCGKSLARHFDPFINNHNFAEPASYSLLHKWMGEQGKWEIFYSWYSRRTLSNKPADMFLEIWVASRVMKFHELTDCSERAVLIYEYLKGE